jgi:hypothetical protein
VAKSLSRRSRSHALALSFANGLVTQRAAWESLRRPQCRSGKWAGALAPELLALCFFVFVFSLPSARARLFAPNTQRAASLSVPRVCARYKSQPVRPSRQRLGAQHQDACTWWGHREPLGQADVQALASTNELGPTGLPLVVSPEASGPADAQAVGRTEASGPANTQVAGSTESLVANADVLQAPPLGAAARGARVYVDVSDCHRSASLTTGPSVARRRSKRLLWKSPPQLLRPLASFHSRS